MTVEQDERAQRLDTKYIVHSLSFFQVGGRGVEIDETECRT